MGPELLIHQMHFIHRVFKVTVQDLTHADSLIRPSAGGNCLNWVLGHIVATRNATLRLLDRDPVWDANHAAPYRRGSEPLDPEAALPLAEIVAAFEASQGTILDALTTLDEAELGQPAKVPATEDDDETLGTELAGLLFHDAYHLGQVGILRRVAGKEGAIP